MFYKTKEEMNGAARIILNTFEEAQNEYVDYYSTTEEPMSFQAFVEKHQPHLYSMIQRCLFVDELNAHFGVLGEMERLGRMGEGDYLKLSYSVTNTGLKFESTMMSRGTWYEIDLEVYHMHAALQGVVLNTPMSDRK